MPQLTNQNFAPISDGYHANPEQRIDDDTFEEYRQIIYSACGINLGSNKRALVAARVAKRIRALNMANHREYLSYVQTPGHQDEMTDLIDAISTNVTSFFREENHFEFLSTQLTKWYAAGQRRFRIWSAASSSGQEPYSLAMTLSETLGMASDVDARILATDISTRVLRIAQLGQYEPGELNGIPKPLQHKYFRHVGGKSGEAHAVSDALRNMVSFRRINLAEPPFTLQGPLDCVFCRNVMIYFDNQVRKRLVTEIHRVLRPGGYLMVGHAESLNGLSTPFRSVRPALYVRD